MATNKPPLSAIELEGRYETADDAIAKWHFHALWLLSLGDESDEVAERLSLSTRWVFQLIKRYNEGGLYRLGDKRVNNGTEPTIVTPQAPCRVERADQDAARRRWPVGRT